MWTPSQVTQARSCGFDCTRAAGRPSRGGANHFVNPIFTGIRLARIGNSVFLLGAWRRPAFVKGVFFGAYVSPGSDPFLGYPPWLAVLGLTLAVALAIWILGKLLKWAMWLLLIAVLVCGFAAALWLLLQG
jgi:hypothetical protein